MFLRGGALAPASCGDEGKDALRLKQGGSNHLSVCPPIRLDGLLSSMPIAYRGRREDGDLQTGSACAGPAFLASSWVSSARFGAANCQAERDGPSWHVSVAVFGVEGRPPAKACDRFRRLLSRKRSLWEMVSSAHGASTVFGRVTVVRCELELVVTANLPSLFQMAYERGGMWCGVMGASAVEWFPQTAFSWQKSGFLFAGWLTAAESMLALFAMRPIKKREGSGRGGFMKISMPPGHGGRSALGA